MSFIYDQDKLLELMQHFYTITGIKTVVFDHELKTIAAYPYAECAFCDALSHVPEAFKKCRASTREGCLLCKQEGNLHIYKCHAGLIEAVTPIRIGDIIVGYMMLGQVLDKTDKDATSKEIARYASHYIGEYTEFYVSRLVCKSDGEIKAAAKIMESCVCDILMNHVIQEGSGKAAFEIVRYIEGHLSEDLSVNALCRQFHLSRNALYKLADTYIGMPVARYVQKKRIEKAALLIKDGLPVTTVAEQLGFCDYGYFGKVFKAVTGKTPTHVKKAR